MRNPSGHSGVVAARQYSRVGALARFGFDAPPAPPAPPAIAADRWGSPTL